MTLIKSLVKILLVLSAVVSAAPSTTPTIVPPMPKTEIRNKGINGKVAWLPKSVKRLTKPTIMMFLENPAKNLICGDSCVDIILAQSVLDI
ncbi:hypothetical protein ACFL6E_02810 [Candidatus Neomarinimicrobiota bacterium]